MATVTGVWSQQRREMIGYFPTSQDADVAIKRFLSKNDGRSKEDGSRHTLDKITLTIT